MTLPNKERRFILNNRVLLFIPNTRWFGKRAWPMVNYASLILTGLLKNHCVLKILDANGGDLSEDECRQRITEFAPRIVMIPTLSFEYYKQNHRAAEITKQVSDDIITMMGGVYVTTMTDQVMEDENVDISFIGHAEERIGDLVDLILTGQTAPPQWQSFQGIGFRNDRGRVVINALESDISQLKSLGEPDYSLFDMTPYIKYRWKKDFQFTFDDDYSIIVTSYGCPYDCVFCATRTITGKHIRFRSAESVINELEFLINSYGVRCFTFVDDCILFNRERIEDILNTIIEKELNIKFKFLSISVWHIDYALIKLFKKAGCEFFVISVESGSERVLKEVIRKPLKLESVFDVVRWAKETGIIVATNWVIGFPTETWDEIRETFRLAEKLDADYSVFHMATPLPKTRLYEQFKEMNFLPDYFSFKDEKIFGFANSFVKTDEFTSFELKVLRSFEWDRINFSTPEKTELVAKLLNLTQKELEEHRKNTRINCGVYY